MSETQYPNQQQLGRDSTWFLRSLARKDGLEGQKRRSKNQAKKQGWKIKARREPGLADSLKDFAGISWRAFSGLSQSRRGSHTPQSAPEPGRL